MVRFIKRLRKNLFSKIVNVFIAFIFMSSMVIPSTSFSQSGALNMPIPGTMLLPSGNFSPALVAGITVHPENPLQLDFIITAGDDNLKGDDFKKESQKLINYFLATLTVPDDEMWVNLSPYEKNRIMADDLSVTEMGRDMLIQDYMLKQFTASLMYPEEELGGEFWQKIYEKTQAKFGTTDIPTNMFNKVWIVPEEAVVYVNGTSVFINESHLKVMLEEDYLAMESNMDSTKHGLGKVTQSDIEVLNEEVKNIIREVILPEIEKEVNEGKTFANLRQIYHSMILAAWYKKNLKQSVLGQVYMDKNKVDGIDLENKEVKAKIYDQYVEAFKTGVYDYIREDYNPETQEIIPRKYFSGGLVGNVKFRQGKTYKILSDRLEEFRNVKVGLNVKGSFSKNLNALFTVLALGGAPSISSADLTLDNIPKVALEEIRTMKQENINKVISDVEDQRGVFGPNNILSSLKQGHLKFEGWNDRVYEFFSVINMVNLDSDIYLIYLDKKNNQKIVSILNNSPRLKVLESYQLPPAIQKKFPANLQKMENQKYKVNQNEIEMSKQVLANRIGLQKSFEKFSDDIDVEILSDGTLKVKHLNAIITDVKAVSTFNKNLYIAYLQQGDLSFIKITSTEYKIMNVSELPISIQNDFVVNKKLPNQIVNKIYPIMKKDQIKQVIHNMKDEVSDDILLTSLGDGVLKFITFDKHIRIVRNLIAFKNIENNIYLVYLHQDGRIRFKIIYKNRVVEKEVYNLDNIMKEIFDKDLFEIKTTGGVDFNPEMLDLKEQGMGLNFSIDKAILNRIQKNSVTGVLPIITNITPMINFSPLLGRSDGKIETEQLSKI